jgi:hypothetical protein
VNPRQSSIKIADRLEFRARFAQPVEDALPSP